MTAFCICQQLHGYTKKKIENLLETTHFLCFLREAGYTALELICMPKTHEAFKEDENLLSMRSEIMRCISTKATRLINRAFPEEKAQPTCFDRWKVLHTYFVHNFLWRDIGMAPRGSSIWKDWAASPG